MALLAVITCWPPCQGGVHQIQGLLLATDQLDDDIDIRLVQGA